MANIKLNSHALRVLVVITNVLILINSLTYSYADLIATQRHGVEVWNVLFSGNIFHYYRYCAANTIVPACYDFPIYLIFAVWNLPCWVYEIVSGNQFENSYICLIHGKMLVIFFYYCSIYLTAKLSNAICNEKSDNIIHYFLGGCSSLLLFFTVYTGTYDIIALVFILLGIYMLFQNKIFAFVFLFSIGATFKYFAIWIFIPIVLLREKRIYRIALMLICCFVPTTLLSLVFDKNEALIESGLNNWANYGRINDILEAGKLDIFNSSISLCIVIYGIICIISYMHNFEEDTFRAWVIYLSALAWGDFLFFVPINGFWSILIVPFLTLLIFQYKDNTYANTLLEFVFSLSASLVFIAMQPWVVGEVHGTSSHLLAKVIVDMLDWSIPAGNTVGDILVNYESKYGVITIAYSIMLASFVVLMIINFPRRRSQEICIITGQLLPTETVLIMRSLVNVLIFYLPTLYYFYIIATNN